jgi:predicted nucleic acid-binding protein
MTYKRLFIDSDIILDILLQREPFSRYAQILFAENKRGIFELNTSALVIANLNYVLTSKVGKAAAKAGLINFLQTTKVLSFEADAIDKALKSSFTDFEDSIQHFIAQKHHCDAIITRNIKDYKHSEIAVFTAEQFLTNL